MRIPGPNLLDRAIGAVAPIWARDRVKARAQVAMAGQLAKQLSGTQPDTEVSYNSTNDGGNGSSGWNGRWMHSAASARTDVLPHLHTLRGQSRDLVRRNPIAASAINTNVVRAVGTGLALSAQPHRGVLGWSEETGPRVAHPCARRVQPLGRQPRVRLLRRAQLLRPARPDAAFHAGKRRQLHRAARRRPAPPRCPTPCACR